MSTDAPLRLLIVDDSAFNRRNIAGVFEGRSDVEVVGRASDGEEALRLATQLEPDVITLDLEMPRMDGFTFLRILMSRRPTAVIVVSSYAQKENVFKALELGALDFVAKPTAQIAPDADDLRDQILEKVLMVRSLQRSSGRQSITPWSDGRIDLAAERPRPALPPRRLVALGSSTGGPTALLAIFAALPRTTPAAFLVAQHMPDKFTRTFAERLDKRGLVQTSEAVDGALVARGRGFVAPGSQCLEVVRRDADLVVALGAPGANDRYVPSADRLFVSIARAIGDRSVAVVLTGMGDDGVLGARAVREAGGLVIAEDASTAVVHGMPRAVIDAGLASEVLPLPSIVERLAALPE